jgi:phytoene desaturase
MLRETERKTARAVVIGSGLGGLAAAVRLGARGYEVTVLEKLDKPGGRAYVFERDGFVFDAGPTIITAPFILEELWERAGRRLEDDLDLVAMNPYYRIRFHDGTHFDYSGDDAAMKEQIARFEPADVAGYEKFLEASAKLYAIGFDELMVTSFHQIGRMMGAIPGLVKAQFYRSVVSLVSRYISNPKLRQVFSFHPLLIGGNPFQTTAVYALIAQLERRYGVHFAMGGMGSLVNGMAGLIEHQGNEIRYNATVEEILLDESGGKPRAAGVRLASGEELAADVVVSNADSAWTYQKLLPERARRRWTDRKLDRARYSMSLFVWYFGTDRRYDDVMHHTIMLGPRYKGLLRDIFQRKVLADDFSLYLHRPTATDPSLAPEGCDAFYVLSPVPNLEADVDWEQQAEPYRQAIEKHLSETLLPDLGRHLVSSHYMTPLDFRDRLLSVKGAAFGLEPHFFQTAWFRPHNVSEDVERLFIVGAGTHPGAGLPGVISSATVLDQICPSPEELGLAPTARG